MGVPSEKLEGLTRDALRAAECILGYAPDDFSEEAAEALNRARIALNRAHLRCKLNRDPNFLSFPDP